MRYARFDDQQVHVAVGAQFAACRRAEQYDTVGGGNRDDTAQDIVEKLRT